MKIELLTVWKGYSLIHYWYTWNQHFSHCRKQLVKTCRPAPKVGVRKRGLLYFSLERIIKVRTTKRGSLKWGRSSWKQLGRANCLLSGDRMSLDRTPRAGQRRYTLTRGALTWTHLGGDALELESHIESEDSTNNRVNAKEINPPWQ